jgi:serine/threonine-protein kinase
MAEALEAVHQAGFIHRDICPRNYLCDPEIENVTLIDFGLTVPDEPPYRLPGNRTGTPLYMAPEIVRRRATDKRVDIFAMGVTAYRLLTFEHPWPGEDLSGKAALAHDTVAPVDILKLRPSLNKTLAEAIRKCLAAVPDDRPPSAEQFLRTIRKVECEDG